MSADQIADLIRRVERIERRLGITTESQMVLGESPMPGEDGKVHLSERARREREEKLNQSEESSKT
jgi:hypothetical protein